MTVMVTGHRKLVPAGHLGNPWPENGNDVVVNHHTALIVKMTEFCRQMYDLGHTDFISGMALGADQLFAKAVLLGKDAGFPIRLIAAVPFHGQEGNWPRRSQEHYRLLLERCDRVEVVSQGGYAPAKMQIRNCWMVDRSQVVLAVWDGSERGGTWNCLTYARQQKRTIVRLNPRILTFNGL